MSQPANKLLAALPVGEYRRIEPLLRTVSLAGEAPLPHCGQTRVYFPGSGLCSIITQMGNGSVIEVACVGSEGIVGLSALAGECPPGQNTFVQVGDGTVQYMPMVLFDREIARNGELRYGVDRFCHSFLETIIQSIACNRLHAFRDRCCRWLLAAHDRLGRARFELKPRFLARAMGVRNSEVAEVLVSLEAQGVIKYDRNSVIVADAIGLRRQACRCYETMKPGYAPVALERKASAPPAATSARILPIRPGVGACTLCGSSTNAPHRTGHECILALDQEIATLTRKTHSLRKYRAQLLADRAQMFRDMLKRNGAS